jgi:hypothetical protein
MAPELIQRGHVKHQHFLHACSYTTIRQHVRARNLSFPRVGIIRQSTSETGIRDSEPSNMRRRYTSFFAGLAAAEMVVLWHVEIFYFRSMEHGAGHAGAGVGYGHAIAE